jgi:hypothetical protein
MEKASGSEQMDATKMMEGDDSDLTQTR